MARKKTTTATASNKVQTLASTEKKKYIGLVGLKKAIDLLKIYIDDKVATIEWIEIVAELPTGSDIKKNTVYFVPDANAEELNQYDEYVYLEAKGSWELLGSVTISLDPSNYYTKTKVDELLEALESKLADYALKSDIPTKVSALTNDAGYLTSANLSSYALKSDIPTKVSALTNDAGYLTDDDFEEATEEEVEALFE